MGTAIAVRSLDYEAEEAASGQDALVKIKERSYAAILMDLQMPEMSGFLCTEKIRALEKGSNRRIPIIAFSSLVESDVKRECLESGIDAFLDKNCSQDQLAKVLNQFVQRLEP